MQRFDQMLCVILFAILNLSSSRSGCENQVRALGPGEGDLPKAAAERPYRATSLA